MGWTGEGEKRQACWLLRVTAVFIHVSRSCFVEETKQLYLEAGTIFSHCCVYATLLCKSKVCINVGNRENIGLHQRREGKFSVHKDMVVSNIASYLRRFSG